MAPFRFPTKLQKVTRQIEADLDLALDLALDDIIRDINNDSPPNDQYLTFDNVWRGIAGSLNKTGNSYINPKEKG